MVDENEQIPQSYILLQFTSIGSVIVKSTFENVTPLQILSMAHLLELEGKLALQEQKFQEQQKQDISKIALPGKSNIKLDKKL